LRKNAIVPPTVKYLNCPVCGFAATDNYTGVHHADCIRCGEYAISSEASSSLEGTPFNDRQAANVCGYLRENQGLMITEGSLSFLRALRPPSVAERATKLLSWLARKNEVIGQEIRVAALRYYTQILARASEPKTMDEATAAQFREILDPLAITWSNDPTELDFLLRTYLASEERFVTVDARGPWLSIIITSQGWRHLDVVAVGTGNMGFVAMWFASEMDAVWENAFYPAIEDAGYTALRIDKKEHNNKIDDEILASIRAARFVVADFTDQRGGVYYEAGFAQGLGKPVIWTIREQDLKNVHFDTRQFNHIAWQPDALDDFKLTLQRRIEASFGHGPKH
jgi:hypothetical protein